MFQWTKRGIERLTWLTLEGEEPAAIAARLGCEESTARKMQRELDLRPRKFERERWSEQERTTLKRMYAETSTDEIAKLLGRSRGKVYQQAGKMGLKKSDAYMEVCAAACGAGLAQSGKGNRFPKGHVPANKGQRRPGYSVGRMSETQFKKGNRSGFAEKLWHPVGSVVADLEGFLRVKIRERINGLPAGWHKDIWPLLHHRTWQEHRGPIPAGHKVVFKNGDRSNCAIENLELITDAEMMRRNTIHNLPPDLKEVIYLKGVIRAMATKRRKAA